MVHAGTPHQRDFPVVKLASERVVVRASNPGQFEPGAGAVMDPDNVGSGAPNSGADGAAPSSGFCHWKKGEGGDDDVCYHVGRVGINTQHVRHVL